MEAEEEALEVQWASEDPVEGAKAVEVAELEGKEPPSNPPQCGTVLRSP